MFADKQWLDAPTGILKLPEIIRYLRQSDLQGCILFPFPPAGGGKESFQVIWIGFQVVEMGKGEKAEKGRERRKGRRRDEKRKREKNKRRKRDKKEKELNGEKKGIKFGNKMNGTMYIPADLKKILTE